MRKYKFRGKTIDHKWVYGSLVYMKNHIVKKWSNDKTRMPDKEIVESICQIYSPNGLEKTTGLQQGQNGNPHKYKQDFIIYEVAPQSVGLFTEMLCENGEIYENDIVLLNDCIEGIKNDLNFVVRWNNMDSKFELYSPKVDRVGNFSLLDVWEIIGNTYDNPELI